jgi:membrane dipeptidase
MWIFDGHLDLAWNAIDHKRDLTLPASEIRAREQGNVDPAVGTCTVSLAELRCGGVGVCIATLLARLHRPGNPMFGYATPEACFAVARGQLAYYEALERGGRVRILKTRRDLQSHASQWESDPAHCPIGLILSMEGADPILDPAQLAYWHEAGLRAVGLTHYGLNRYGGGTAVEDGLAPEAGPLLAEIERLGMPLDLTHLSDRAFWEAVEIFGGRVLASHQNARELVPHQRQFTDDQIRVVIERGGVVGAAFDVWMLEKDYVRSASERKATLESVADHIEHVCRLAGNAGHAALGTDLDGGFGLEQSPLGLETIADLPKMAHILARRGFDYDEIAAVMHGNWMRFFLEVLPE